MTSFLLALSAVSVQAVAISPSSVAQATEVAKLATLNQDVIVEGASKAFGIDGTYSLTVGSGGRFLTVVKSPLSQSVGYDGTAVWESDRSGATRLLAFGSEDTQKLQGALLTNAWLLPGAATIKPGDNRTLNVRLNGSEIDQVISLDQKTNLPTSMTYQGAAGKVEVLLENWTSTPAGKLPFKVTWREGGVEQVLSGSKTRTVPPQPSAFKMPAWTATDTTFNTAIPAQVETRRLPSGHMIVKGAINGKDAGWFIFDSGAEAMCVDKGIANELGLKQIGEVPAVGVGGVEKVPFRVGDSFTVGPMTMKNTILVQLDLAQIGKLLNLKLGGIIGYDVFRRSIVEMDVKKPSVSLLAPGSFKGSVSNWVPIKFDGGNVGLEAEFEGNRKGWFRLDTGAAGTVSFHGPFVEKYELLKDRKVERIMEGGVGGMQEARRGKIDYFAMAGHRFEKPDATFSISKTGAFHNHWLIGNVGQNFIDPFVLVFDYPNSRIGFTKRQ